MHFFDDIPCVFDPCPHEVAGVLAQERDDVERAGDDVCFGVLEAGEQDGPERVDEGEEGVLVLGEGGDGGAEEGEDGVAEGGGNGC